MVARVNTASENIMRIRELIALWRTIASHNLGRMREKAMDYLRHGLLQGKVYLQPEQGSDKSGDQPILGTLSTSMAYVTFGPNKQ